MKKKLIIHGGMHKTGTSSIQFSLNANKALLQQNGITFPEEGLARDKEVGFRHLYISNMLKKHAFNADTFLEVVHSLLEYDAHTIILTHEDFFRKDIHPQGIALLDEYFEISLVVYVKDPVRYFNDKYKEWVRRQNCTLEAGEFILSHLDYLHWHQILPIWEKVIGRSNIFMNALSGDDLIGEFYGLVNSIAHSNVNIDELLQVKRANTSLSNSQILLMLINNRAKPKLPSHLFNTAGGITNDTGLVLSHECVRQIKAKSWHALHYLKTKYGLNIEIPPVDQYVIDEKFSDIQTRAQALNVLRSLASEV
ncbi:hypothetical protein [Alteromonas sp. 14N.309.X.WAT.G.H12]|uniref:hypothetical protein n=1 Tax=Alteromonas sp. 14N.309.X.WAT.G.H12 TaxID=3120824 RepID=UPI002FD3D786